MEWVHKKLSEGEPKAQSELSVCRAAREHSVRSEHIPIGVTL